MKTWSQPGKIDEHEQAASANHMSSDALVQVCGGPVLWCDESG